MADVREVQIRGAQGDRAQGREATPTLNQKTRMYRLALSIGAAIVFMAVVAVIAAIVAAAVSAVILSRSGETTATVSNVGDHSNMMQMGHLLLTEWDVAGMKGVLANQVKLGDSVLEAHNDGQTVHRFAIWRGGVVEGDQVVGGTLLAETGYIRPGEFTSLDVDLEAGEYVLVCSVRGHTARGMYSTVHLQ